MPGVVTFDVLAYLTIMESGLRRLVAKDLGDSLLDGSYDARRVIVEARR
jgi:hypothetical protein